MSIRLEESVLVFQFQFLRFVRNRSNLLGKRGKKGTGIGVQIPRQTNRTEKGLDSSVEEEDGVVVAMDETLLRIRASDDDEERGAALIT